PYSVLFRPTGSELNVGIGASTDFAWNFENTFMKRGAHSLSFEPYSIDGLRTANPVTSRVFVGAEDFPLYEKGAGLAAHIDSRFDENRLQARSSVGANARRSRAVLSNLGSRSKPDRGCA